MTDCSASASDSSTPAMLLKHNSHHKYLQLHTQQNYIASAPEFVLHLHLVFKMLFEMIVNAIFHFLYPRSHYLPLILSLRLVHKRDLS
jgi:hypothetical protein